MAIYRITISRQTYDRIEAGSLTGKLVDTGTVFNPDGTVTVEICQVVFDYLWALSPDPDRAINLAYERDGMPGRRPN